MYLKIAVLLLIIFGAFTFLVHQDFYVKADENLLHLFQGFLPRALDLPFSFFSFIGSFEVVVIFILLLWVIYRKLRIITVLGFLALFHVVELFAKAQLHQIQPSIDLVRTQHLFSFPSGIVHPGFSYPSGHAGRTTFVAVVLFVLIWNSKLSGFWKIAYCSLLIAFCFFMSVSRIYLAEHWTTDVLGGAILGASMGFFIFSIKAKE